MSIRATTYTIETLAELDADLSSGARLVLLTLAVRANSECGVVIGGTWVRDVTGLHAGSVRRHVDQLEQLGLVAVKRRPGRSHLVRFPLAGFIHNPAHECAGCRAWNARSPRALVRATPRTGARHPAHWCAPNMEENREVEPRRLTREQIARLVSDGKAAANE